MDINEVNCRNAERMELVQNHGFSSIDSLGSATMKLL
jgi:hypothetical protein